MFYAKQSNPIFKQYGLVEIFVIHILLDKK